MVYSVIISLNSVGKRRVGDIISVLERRGLEFLEIRKKITSNSCKEFPTVDQLILKAKLQELEAMEFYHEKFDADVLDKKINYFYGNHVELFFESGEKIVDPNELWEFIAEFVFDKGRKLPIMFVVATSEENGFEGSFIPDDFEAEGMCRIDIRTITPLKI